MLKLYTATARSTTDGRSVFIQTSNILHYQYQSAGRHEANTIRPSLFSSRPRQAQPSSSLHREHDGTRQYKKTSNSVHGKESIECRCQLRWKRGDTENTDGQTGTPEERERARGGECRGTPPPTLHSPPDRAQEALPASSSLPLALFSERAAALFRHPLNPKVTQVTHPP